MLARASLSLVTDASGANMSIDTGVSSIACCVFIPLVRICACLPDGTGYMHNLAAWDLGGV